MKRQARQPRLYFLIKTIIEILPHLVIVLLVLNHSHAGADQNYAMLPKVQSN